MKRLKGFMLGTALMLTGIFGMMPETTYAQEEVPSPAGAVEMELSAPRESYKSGEEINVMLHISNQMDCGITEVTVHPQYPEGLTVMKGFDESPFSLGAGEEKDIPAVLLKAPAADDTQPSTDGKPVSGGPGSQPKPGQPGTASSVQTGDSFHPGWAFLILLAAAVIVFSLVRMKKKGRNRFWAILLAAGLSLGALAPGGRADAAEAPGADGYMTGTEKASLDLTIEGVKTTIMAEITYTYEKEAEEPGEDNPENPGGATGEENPLMQLNEEGFFAQAFCREMDTSVQTSLSDGAMIFYAAVTDEARAVLDTIKTAGDIYEYASLTFYPDGTVRQCWKINSEVYDAFCEGATGMFAIIVPEEKEQELTYAVDKTASTVTLSDGTVLTLDIENEGLSGNFLVRDEKYTIEGKVEGESSGSEKHYVKLSDISYGNDARNTMDIFLPENLDTAKDNGAFVIVYGGGWTSGDKASNWSLAEQYAEAGYTAVTVNLRNCYYNEETKQTEITVYDMLNDMQASVRTLKELSDENGWNITQIATKGFSSGANIALLYAYSRGADVSWFDTETVLPVRFVADVVGPVDMHDSAWYEDYEWPEEDRTLMTAPGAGPAYAMLLPGAANKGELNEEELENCINSMSPVWYVDNGGGVPTVMGYSRTDYIQSPNNGKRLQGHLDAQGIRSDLYTFLNSIHGYSEDQELAQEYFDKTIEYAETYFIK